MAPGGADTRSAGHYLWWLVCRQKGRTVAGAAWSVLWMLALTLPPLVLQRAIDDGLGRRDTAVLLGWAGALLAVGIVNAVSGLMRHRIMSRARADASLRTVDVLTRHIATLGAVLPRTVATGEVVAVGGRDAALIGRTMTATGPGVAAVITYAAIAVILVGVSPLLAAVVLLGVPLLAVTLGPVLRRLHRAEAGYREQQGALTERAADLVAGLRVLRGIGGADVIRARYDERSRAVRAEGYRVSDASSWVAALAVGLPALFLAVVTWLAADEAAAAHITVGQLVAVYGYVSVLVIPVHFFVEGADDLPRGLVSAGRVVRILRLRPDQHPGGGPGPDGPGPLVDPASGLVVAPGSFTVVAAADPSDAIELADRLGRYADSDATFGAVPLREITLSEVRRRIVVAEHDAHLFAGASPPADDAAVHAAGAADVVGALPPGTVLGDGARTLSGGQRQRLRLARALAAEPEVLVLVEPTSAVDAPTEALIAERLRTHRRNRTTIVLATSPLLLDRADHVALLVHGRITACGTHSELLESDVDYRALVFRA